MHSLCARYPFISGIPKSFRLYPHYSMLNSWDPSYTPKCKFRVWLGKLFKYFSQATVDTSNTSEWIILYFFWNSSVNSDTITLVGFVVTLPNLPKALIVIYNLLLLSIN